MTVRLAWKGGSKFVYLADWRAAPYAEIFLGLGLEINLTAVALCATFVTNCVSIICISILQYVQLNESL